MVGWADARRGLLVCLQMGEESHILLDENYLSREECKYLVSLYETF